MMSAKPLAEYQMLLRRGCSRRVHHIVTIINIEGELSVSDVQHVRVRTHMEASKAPRMNRNTSKPGKEVKAAQIMQLAPHPKKQKQIQ